MHVKAVKTISLGKILGHLTGKSVSNVAVGLQYLINILIHLGHISLVPDDLSRAVGWLQGIACHFEYPLFSHLLTEFFADVVGSGIHPDGRICQHAALFVYRYG